MAKYVKVLSEQIDNETTESEFKEVINLKKPLFNKSWQAIKQSLEIMEINKQWKNSVFGEFSKQLTRFYLRQEVEDDESF